MNVLIFNGSLDTRQDSTAGRIADYYAEKFWEAGYTPVVFDLAEAGIPFFDHTLAQIPAAAEQMCALFREADIHVWLSPLYHGSMTGVMKNCLDWLEISAGEPAPYLTGKVTGLVCWAAGVQAMQGINAMDAVAKALRSWVLPYAVPICRKDLYDEGMKSFSAEYLARFNRMIALLAEARPVKKNTSLFPGR
ncbi:NAD(P)H-dependent oxidoreductase [Compostibacter hankyongensis]|uniref:NADPH-dependent FMN reductase-like domain-containing protein n=1 Tax=Compostibacter hankyongensis TaxID=1007089 RepID=A0ABP8FQT9_9BACT